MVKSLVRKVLREEGLVPAPVIVIGPDCQLRVLEDATEPRRSFPMGQDTLDWMRAC